MSSLVRVLKESLETQGLERTLVITKPGPLYGVVVEEVTVQDIGKLTMQKLIKIADKTLDLQRPFLIKGEIALFYSEFLLELSNRKAL